MGFADAVKVMREQRHLTKAELAERSGLAPSYMSRLESGDYKSPSIETLVSIARGMEMDPRDLLVLSGYVPEDYVSAVRVVSEEQVVRITQEAIRRISEVARDSLNMSVDKESISQSGGFDPESLADKLTQRRQLVGLTINQVARRARVPQRQIGGLEDGTVEYEPPELRHILVSGYGLSDQEVSHLIIEMSLHSLLRRQPEVSESQRTMIVDVAIAAMRREATE